ncbi:MAG TPA: trehalose-phosphatase [Dokdonella sp.]
MADREEPATPMSPDVPMRAIAAQPPIARADAIALFLDVDGTLVDFAPSPGEARADPALRDLLESLAIRLDGALALISGRELDSIDALLGLPRLAAAGLHGAQVRRVDGHVARFDGISTPMPALRVRANAFAATVPGVLVEHKYNAIALHYRAAPHAATAVHAAAQELLSEAGPTYELMPGNAVVELKPAGATKGTALAALMREAPFAGRIPWVFGDDFTDEHAFDSANALGGVSVIVGPRRPTAAQYALADPAAMRRWLSAFAADAEGMEAQ